MKHLILFTLFVSIGVTAEDYSGLWIWENNSKAHTFSIKLHREGEVYKGSYCAVGMSGSRVDCSPKSNNYFITKLDGGEFTFKTNYSSVTGKAKLRTNGDSLIWVVAKAPLGENYAPKAATLLKSK